MGNKTRLKKETSLVVLCQCHNANEMLLKILVIIITECSTTFQVEVSFRMRR